MSFKNTVLSLAAVPFIIAAALIAGSAIWAIEITVVDGKDWSRVFSLGRYAFYFTVAGLMLVIISQIIGSKNQQTQNDEKSASE